MVNTWVLVADRSRARLFTVTDTTDLVEIESMLNLEARAPARELVNDELPSTHESFGLRRSRIEPHTTLKEKIAHRFAREIREVLERGRVEHRYERLIIAAPAKFLGVLNECFSKPLRECIVLELNRNLTTISPAKIHEFVPKKFWGKRLGLSL